MKCPKCQKENVEDAKFCVECGHSLAQEEIIEEVVEEEAVESIEEEIPEIKEEDEPEKKIWYYVLNNQSVGPYTQTEMIQMIQEKKILANTYIWKSGLQDWIYVKNSELAAYLFQKEEPKDEKEVDDGWYYVDINNSQQGPYSKEEMRMFLEQGMINGNTFVWQQGLADWIHCKDSTLFTGHTNAQTNFYANGNTTKQTIEIRSIPMQVLLSVVTCGLYGLYWLYTLANDINRLNTAQGKPAGTDAFLVVLLSIFTCGLYEIYFYWKAGKLLRQLQFENGYIVEDNSLITMILAIFGLGLVSRCILQNTLNDVQRYA